MQRVVSVASMALLVAALAVAPATVSKAGSPGTSPEEAAAPAPGPVLETLLKADLEGAEGTEVILSRVTLPPHTSLPRHWHPGEEFAYVLEGSLTLWMEGEEEIVARAGEVAKVPLRKVHAASTGDESATVLVFRVHEMGQPERILVE